MRCWTVGERSVFWQSRRLVWFDKGESTCLEGFEEPNPYQPLDALAVHPTRDVVWIGGDHLATWRIDIATGERTRFDTTVADLCYVADDELWAVSGTKKSTDLSGTRQMLRFGDAPDAQPERLELPDARPVRWPYGPAYAYGAGPIDDEPLSLSESFRITKSLHGVCIASSGGYIWGFPTDDVPFGWKVAPVYQGWLVARLTAQGVLATALQNGRTGEVVAFDHDGCWYDAFDTNWHSISPAVPVDDGYLVGWDSDSARILGGYPMSPIAEGVVGARITDLAVADDGSQAVWIGDDRHGDIRLQDGQWTSRRSDDLYEADVLARIAEPVEAMARWTWQRKSLAELPALSPAIPDPERTEALIDTLRKAGDTDVPEAREEYLAAVRREFPWHKWETEHLRDPQTSVYERLLRDAAPLRPTRQQVRALAARVIDAEASDFERYHARACLPGPAPDAVDGTSVDDVLDAALRGPEDSASISGRQHSVFQAHLSGVVDESGVRWTAVVALRDGATIALECEALPAHALTTPPEARAPSNSTSATGAADRQPLEMARLEVEPYFEHAIRLIGEAREPSMWFDCVANFRGLLCPDCDDLAEAIALAARHVDLNGWYAARTAKGVRLSVFAADFDTPTACENPAPHPAARALFDALVDADLLLLERALTDDELRRIQWALFSGGSPTRRVDSLEDQLLEMDAVEDLFGTTEVLSEVVATVLDRF